MTEPNAAPETAWPALPEPGAGADRDVERLLERLGTLPGLPVSGHGEVYTGLHRDLLAALNDPGDTAP